MLDKPLTPQSDHVCESGDKMSFTRAVTKAWFIRTKMERKMKTLSRVLTWKTKSWDPSSYSPKNLQNVDVAGKYVAHTGCLLRECQQSEELLQKLNIEEGTADVQLAEEETSVYEKEPTTTEISVNFDQLTDQENSQDATKTQRCLANPGRKQNCYSMDDTEMKGLSKVKIVDLATSKIKQDQVCKHCKPEILPPKTKKCQVYRNPDVFRKLDIHAMKISKRDYSCLADLVTDLTSNCKNDLEKSRVLFRWVVELDPKYMENRARHNICPNLLQRLRQGKESSHQLFKNMCRHAGIYCEVIRGYSKGVGYKPCMDIEQNVFRNTWTAVAIDGSWRFVNCTWAARHVTKTQDESSETFHKFDEFYFLTDPEDHIYQHYPDDPVWQLLVNPLSSEEFVNLPVVKSPFFNHGFSFPPNHRANLITDNGVCEISLAANRLPGIGSRLDIISGIDSEQTTIEGAILQRFIGGKVIFKINLPQPGQYYFSVFTGDYWNPECLESACSFLIKHTGSSILTGPTRAPFPPVPCYGPTPAMDLIGVSPDSHPDPLIVSTGGNLAIKLNVVKDTKLTQTLEYFDSHDGSLTDTDRYVFVRSRDDSSISYTISCPEKGYYVFSVFGTDGSGDSSTLDCVYRYLIVCQSDNKRAIAFPKTYQSWMNCVLHEPLHGDLLPSTTCTFRLDVPNAEELFVLAGDTTYKLTKWKNSRWEGDVRIEHACSTVKVVARYNVNGDCSLIARLLAYDVLEEYFV